MTDPRFGDYEYDKATLALEEQAETFIEYLRGSCNSVPSEMEDEPYVEELVYAAIDVCQTCGWWHDTHELDVAPNGTDLECDECRAEREIEEADG